MMKNRFIFLFGFLLLVGCQPVYQTSYEFVPPEKEKQLTCLKTCSETKNQCEQLCPEIQAACTKQAKMAKQGATVGPNNLNLEQDPLQCIENCGCEKDYRACYRLCGGKIEQKKICIANCAQAK